MKPPRSRSTTPLSLAPPPVEAPPPPPMALAEVDRARLQAAHLQLQVDDLTLRDLARQHGELSEQRKADAAAMEALGADLRARYALGDRDMVNPETGAITRA